MSNKGTKLFADYEHQQMPLEKPVSMGMIFFHKLMNGMLRIFLSVMFLVWTSLLTVQAQGAFTIGEPNPPEYGAFSASNMPRVICLELLDSKGAFPQTQPGAWNANNSAGKEFNVMDLFHRFPGRIIRVESQRPLFTNLDFMPSLPPTLGNDVIVVQAMNPAYSDRLVELLESQPVISGNDYVLSGLTQSVVQTTPEPGTLAIVAIGGGLLLLGRWKKVVRL